MKTDFQILVPMILASLAFLSILTSALFFKLAYDTYILRKRNKKFS